MKRENLTRNRIIHLALSGVALSLAAGPLKHSKWKYSLYSAAGWGIARYVTGTFVKPESGRARPAAREVSRSEVVDGITMRWEEHGDAFSGDLPVILLHGLPTNPRVWRYVVPGLTKAGVRCLAWEQVGFGWSMHEGLGRDLSIPKQAEYLSRWLQHLGIDRAIFVGHDFGGGVVQRLLADHPEVVAGVVLTDSVAYENWPVPAVRAAQSLAPALRLAPPAFLKPILFAAVKNLHSTRKMQGESFEVYWAPYNRGIGPGALAHQLKHFRNKDTMSAGRDLERMNLSLPARVVWGEKDPLGLHSATRLARTLNTALTVVPNGKHFTIEDQPEPIIESILSVVDEVNSRAGSNTKASDQTGRSAT